MRQSGDQSRGWRCSRRAGEALTWAAVQIELALRDSLSLLLSSLFVFPLPLHPSSLTAFCLPFLPRLSLSPSFHFDYSLLLHLSAASLFSAASSTLPSFLPIFLSGTHHLSSVVFLCHPHPPLPLIFTPSIQFKELYWHHKMNFMSLGLSFWNICLLLTNSPLLLPLHKTPSCAGGRSHGQCTVSPVHYITSILKSRPCILYYFTHEHAGRNSVLLIPGCFTSTAEAWVLGHEGTASLIKSLKSSLTVWDGLGGDFYVYSDTMWKFPVRDSDIRMPCAAGTTAELHFSSLPSSANQNTDLNHLKDCSKWKHMHAYNFTVKHVQKNMVEFCTCDVFRPEAQCSSLVVNLSWLYRV